MDRYIVGCSPITLTKTKMHSHKVWEIIVNTSGSGIEVIQGESHPFSPRMVTCIPPGYSHQKFSNEGFYDFYLHTPDFPVPNTSPSFAPILFTDTDRTIEVMLRLLFKLEVSSSTGAAHHLYLAFMQHILERLHASCDSPIVAIVKNHLEEHLNDPDFSTGSALVVEGYTPDYVRKIFKQETGMTPNAYLRQIRIAFAKELLKKRELLTLSITDIAFMSGFNDAAYFTRIFKSDTGMSPKEFS